MATKKLTKQQRESIAKKIISYLVRRDLFYDVHIYINNQRWSSEKHPGSRAIQIGRKPITVYIEDDIDARAYNAYANPDTITVSFEGPLYDEINYGSAKAETDINQILDKYGLYLEYGYAWSFSAYF